MVMLARLEELVIDEMFAVGWRIWACLKLVRVWASLRWSDVQAILVGELRMKKGGQLRYCGGRRLLGQTGRLKSYLFV